MWFWNWFQFWLKRNVRERAKEKRNEEEKEKRAKGPRCWVIGVYLVGSQNSPTAAPSSLGNFLNSDPPARNVFCRFIFSPKDNRAQHTHTYTQVLRSTGEYTPRLVLLSSPVPASFLCVFSQFILRCLSARLDLSTYKWRSFVRLC